MPGSAPPTSASHAGSGAITPQRTQLDVFALDEAQRLAPWQEARLFLAQRRAGWRLIIGSHRDHRLAFALAGLPVVTVRVGRQTTRARLARILARRLAVFAKGGDPAVSFSADAVDYLHRSVLAATYAA